MKEFPFGVITVRSGHNSALLRAVKLKTRKGPRGGPALRTSIRFRETNNKK